MSGDHDVNKVCTIVCKIAIYMGRKCCFKIHLNSTFIPPLVGSSSLVYIKVKLYTISCNIGERLNFELGIKLHTHTQALQSRGSYLIFHFMSEFYFEPLTSTTSASSTNMHIIDLVCMYVQCTYMYNMYINSISRLIWKVYVSIIFYSISSKLT